MSFLNTLSRISLRIPAGAKFFIQHRTYEVFGLALAGFAGFAAFALATWSPADPSLNHAGTLPTLNWMGTGGAYFSDFVFQFFGLGGLLIIVPPMIWGIRLIRHHPPRRPLWLCVALTVCVMMGSAGLSVLESPQGWPLLTGPGGFLGDTAGSFLIRLGEPFVGSPAAGFMTGWLTGTAAAVLFVFALDPRGALEGYRFDWRGFKNRKPPHDTRRRRKDVEPGLLRRFGYWASDTANDFFHRRTNRSPSPPNPGDPLPEKEENLSQNRSARVSRPQGKIRTSKRAEAEAQPRFGFSAREDFTLPTLNLLAQARKKRPEDVLPDDALEQNARLLEEVLDDFGIRGEIIDVRPGPLVTLYELKPAPGIKSSRVVALSDDIARSMSAVSARVAVVPGRNIIGIELPNTHAETVYLRQLLSSADFENTTLALPLALGKDIGGEPVIADLARMPHLLIAGTTGSGKSVGINAMILSILYRMTPETCKLIMIDPKMLELSVYDGIPHLITPVVTEPRKAVMALKWVVKEMENRYRNMSMLGVRNMSGFNARIEEALASGETIVRTVQTGFDKETGEAIYEEEEIALDPMPFIVVIVDEMADLMMVAGKEIEIAVQRLAQMARAAGIHMITATQRPSVDVITGTIKANFPTRISFQVTSKIDSRTILGEQGAEQLLGQGDMLYMAGGSRAARVHGPFVSDKEVEKVVRALKKQGTPEYLHSITTERAGEDTAFVQSVADRDELYDKAVAIVGNDKRASTSYIQRRLQIGYNRAARLMEQMEEEGVISPPNPAGKREVLIGNPGEGIKH